MPQWRQEGKASSEGSLHSSGPTVLGEELQRELGGGGGGIGTGPIPNERGGGGRRNGKWSWGRRWVVREGGGKGREDRDWKEE